MFTLEQEKEIIKLKHEGKSYKEIAKLVNSNRSAIYLVLKSNNLTNGKTGTRYPLSIREDIIKLREQGVSYKEIIAKYKIHRTTITRIVCPKKRRFWQPANLQEAVNLRMRGYSFKEIARIVEGTPYTIALKVNKELSKINFTQKDFEKAVKHRKIIKLFRLVVFDKVRINKAYPQLGMSSVVHNWLDSNLIDPLYNSLLKRLKTISKTLPRQPRRKEKII